jgi:hypothetical protein
MARQRPYDPLNNVPSPEVVREKLAETVALAKRLRILLRLSERDRTAAQHQRRGYRPRRRCSVMTRSSLVFG